ncbi:hypothetical protein IWW55_006671 [Coemansia sp. RSA 2706]|nr:hypothetical protein LPJ63_003176 [Coemansia sp. RSA 2711]KAJ2287667.1 hypothetical protein IWW55_006671 [Coemansia sp. RSA 2706]KAJ2298103.1 hypothetical protein IWW54_006689 [Coemansia sp. RSA 2705]KAJ2304638.1 hypothetical protein IWW52_006565 [Coemansia sp. RSA 2704]KAJ2314009.1 hypothetical protein IWW51_006039 [Coemansia sp. RSA 2702]KAJ2710937.1 hypothetical protein H4R23_006478 [Coemansia sp. Cherry 401B]
MPLSYIVIFERTSPENIIFASSNCQRVLGYTPQEMLGTSAMSYSADTHAKHYSCEWPADNPELGVTMMPHNLLRKDGSVVFTHAIAINCSGYIFTVVNAFPELGRVHLGESILYRLQHETDYNALDADKARASLDSSSSSLAQRSAGNSSSAEDLVNLKLPQVTKDSLHRAHVFTARASRIKACMILSQASDGATHGPTVEFVTNTISNIYSGDVDAHELVNVPFFSLVAPADIAKAALYLDNIFAIPRPQLCSLRLVRHPALADNGAASPAESDAEEPIEIEVFGASSGNKAMLLCQRIRRNRKPVDFAAANRRAGFNDSDDDLPYMSLEEIISSDPDSSDLNEQWYEVQL